MSTGPNSSQVPASIGGPDASLVRDIAARTGFAPAFIWDKYARLRVSPASDLQPLIEQLLVQETFFFRHTRQWQMLRDMLGNAQPASVTAWCAGCATGEEAWSLAYLLADMRIARASILATDISPVAVATARTGRYHRMAAMGSFRDLPAFASAAFPTRQGEVWTAPANLRAIVSFDVHNLMDNPPAELPRQAVDLVFCRNTLIYFSQAAAARVLRHLAGVMRPGGLLLLGTAETAGGSPLFEPVHGDDTVLWRRTATPLSDDAA